MFLVQYLPPIAELLHKNHTGTSAKTEGFSLGIYLQIIQC